MAGNRLAGETSPYLLQHKDNPVDWMPWGSEALDLARRENRPILLSVGYAACHWCHVMAHESFENPETAALMNRLFVNIKVDREERPDLDAIYQTSLAMLGEQGGWPLTMFLTPDGHPFWGGTYFPPEARYGRPGFRDVLAGIAGVYRNDPERVRKNVTALTDALRNMASPPPGSGITPEILDRIASRLLQEVDPVHGGTLGAPKFPQPPLFRQLWHAWRRSGDARYRDAVTVTLDNICQGGIYDHLGGGFARYSVDARWLAPHFEKMLYDNAQLVELLVAVWRETQNPLYAARVEETIGWLLREMQGPAGGFASSLDADSEGVEGKYYVWDKAEIDALLGDDAEMFAAFYDVSGPGNWEGATILNRLGAMALSDAATEARLAAARARLLAVREDRIPPAKDDKLLADWNGLAISALAVAGQAFGRADWIDAAQRALAFVRDRMTEGGRLRHSWRDGRLNHPATLDDYANMARAALLLYEATGDAGLVAQAEAWVDCVRAHHADDAAGGYFFAAADTPDLIVRNKTAIDNPTPSGNGVMAEVLARLWLLTGKESCRAEAEAVLQAFSGETGRNFFPLSTLLLAAEYLFDPAQIVVIGAPGADDTAALLAAARRDAPPASVLQPLVPDQPLPDGHPAAGMAMQGGGATAYLCRGQSCSLPITAPDGLAQALARR